MRTWASLCEDSSWDDVPYKVEIDADGQIVLAAPFSVRRSLLKARLARFLQDVCGDLVTYNAAVQHALRVCVADVAWMEPAFFEAHADNPTFTSAPALCVEIQTTENADVEMREKAGFYLARGAQEVWICAPDGRLRFFVHGGEVERSPLAPEAPAEVTL